MNKLNNWIDKNINKVLFYYLLAQPFLDVIAGIFTMFDIKNVIGISARLIFFILCSYYLFFMSKKNISKYFLCITYIYLIMFTLNIAISKDISTLYYELQNTLNAFYFPVTFLALFEIIPRYKIRYSIKQIICLLGIYILFVFIPTITHTNLNSYEISKVGSAGWFYSTNSISAIICIMIPFLLIYIKENKNKFYFWIPYILITLYSIFTLGTKVPILGIGLIIICNIIYILISFIKKKRYIPIIITFLILCSTMVVAINIVPKTSFYKNIKIHMNYLEISSPLDALKNPYLIDHFIFSQRLTFFKHTAISYNNSNIIDKLIGIGYIEGYATDNVNTKTIEMDYFDIFYRHGILGFIIYFTPLFIYLKERKKINYDTYTNLNINLSICFIFILAFFSGHIFIAPATSIIVSIIFVLKNGALKSKDYN